MSRYHVAKTTSGGYWVTDDYSESVAVSAGVATGSALGEAIGQGLVGIGSLRRQWADRRRAAELERAASEMDTAGDADDWSRVYLLATDLCRRQPDEALGHLALAAAACKLGRPEEALRLAEQMASAEMAEPEILKLIRSQAYVAAGDTASLIREVRGLIDSRDPDLRQFALSARAHAMLWLGDLDQALRDADSAVSDNPTELAYELRGDVRWARGEVSKAEADYAFALRLAPNDEVIAAKKAAVAGASAGPAGRTSVADSAPPKVTSPRPPATTDTEPNTATLTVRRVHQKKDLGGAFKLMVDCSEQASLADGGMCQLTLSPGNHDVQIQWGPRKSNQLELNLRPGAQVVLECGLLPGFMMMPLVIREAGTGDKEFAK
jgi:tetratricopeptide (TPR) repeat protein